jgi:sugar lactone lactonase YvrE
VSLRATILPNLFRARHIPAILALGAVICLAQNVTEITLGNDVFPESITSSEDGTLIVGSFGKGSVLRIAPGKTTAEEWIKPGTGGLNSVLGVYADDKANLLWVCSNKAAGVGETTVKTFDLKTGAPKASYPVAGERAFCNDIAVGEDGSAYLADTLTGSVLMIRRGATAPETISADPVLAGADGLAFGDRSTLYVNSVTTNKLVRLDLDAQGKAKSVTELKTSRPLERPDGMRAIGTHRLLLAENAGRMSIVTFSGPDRMNAVITNLKDGLDPTPAVTATKGMAWVAEGRLNYRNDAKLKGKEAPPAKLYAVPLPK